MNVALFGGGSLLLQVRGKNPSPLGIMRVGYTPAVAEGELEYEIELLKQDQAETSEACRRLMLEALAGSGR